MPGQVDGKIALVTGGASGIGRATALTFAREGAKLVVADMNDEGGHQTVHMITENGGHGRDLGSRPQHQPEGRMVVYEIRACPDAQARRGNHCQYRLNYGVGGFLDGLRSL